MKKRVDSSQWPVASKVDAQKNHPSSFTLHPSRRGILLLVVLSMLTLFLLIGTTFIVSSNHYRKAQKIQNRLTETSNSSIDQGNFLDEVINQLVRDTNNQNSALRFHSLLRDMYGNDAILASIGDFVNSAGTVVNSVEWATAVPGDGTDITNGQVLQFILNPATVTDQFGQLLTTLSANNNFYNGLVLTFLDGPARSQSVRIIGHEAVEVSPGIFNARLRVITPRLADGSNITDVVDASGQSDFDRLLGSRIIINGRPFNGTGTGYNRDTAVNAPRLTAGETLRGSDDPNLPDIHLPIGLMPNGAFFNPENVRPTDYILLDPTQTLPGGTQLADWNSLNQIQQQFITNFSFAGLGGSDESYDAVDFQNMALALMPVDPGETAIPNLDAPNPQPNRTNLPASLTDILGNSMVVPSFHRPALLNYWASRPVFDPMPAMPTPTISDSTLGEIQNVSLLRKILLRPNWLDHPNFTGSNPEWAALAPNDNQGRLLRSIYGPWDVDNDNDGIRDSVWIDFGAQVIEDANGRLVKPMAAILVLDQDGRLNLNAHGSRDIAFPTTLDPNEDLNDDEIPDFDLAGPTPTSPVSSDTLPAGQGFGVAEISLEPILGDALFGRSLFGTSSNDQVFSNAAENAAVTPVAIDSRRRFRRRLAGKFGNVGVGLAAGEIGGGGDQLPGRPQEFDLSAQLKLQGVPLYSNGLISVGVGADGILGYDEPTDTYDDITVLGGYASPPDLRGRYAIGLNRLGQPVFEGLDFEDRDGDGVLADEELFDEGVFANQDTPYEVDLSLNAIRGENENADDSPYSLAELERILRAYDADAGTLAPRIWELAGEFRDSSADTTANLNTLNLWRTTLTTDSYDLPVPNVLVPEWMRVGPDGVFPSNDDFVSVMNRPAVGVSFADLLEYQMRIAPVLANPAATPITAALTPLQRQQLAQLLPQDLANGLRLDINRPIGNGRDDNNNNVVDEPGEFSDANSNGIVDPGEETFWVLQDNTGNAIAPGTLANSDPRRSFIDERGQFRDSIDRDGNGIITDAERGDIDGDGAIDAQELVLLHNLRRQRLARDLYVMAMTLIDPLTAAATDEDRANRARRLAQWAINVVDFRDPDNIMTAFEYDINPFDGWQVDGSLVTGPTNNNNDLFGPDNQLNTNDDIGGVVWGAERPELLITETLAWHDRRTEPNAVPPTFGTGDNDDTEYDQAQTPRGYGFIELYNPWPENPATNSDTYGTDANGNFGVNLARTHDAIPGVVDDPLTGDPVWRIAVYKRAGPGSDPEALELADQPQNFNFQNRADRGIYFVNPEDRITSDLVPVNQVGTTPGKGNPMGGTKFEAFYSSLPVPTVAPGSYLVIGSGEDQGNNGQYLAIYGEETVSGAERGILLNLGGNTNADALDITTNQITVQASDGDPVGIMDQGGFPVQVNNVAITIIDRASTDNPTEFRRFSFSEPARGYPALLSPRDIPFDDERLFVANSVNSLEDGETRLTLPANLNGGRTVPGFSWVYLQRLANPTMPWDEDTNPYRTIDAMGVNVTTYTGLDDKEERVNNEIIETFGNFDAVEAFASIQRGRSNNPLAPGSNPSLNELQQAAMGAQNPRNITAPQIQANLWGREAFGADNTSFAGFWRNQSGPQGNGVSTPGTLNFDGVPDCTLGFLNEPFRAPGMVTLADVDNDGDTDAGDIRPQEPFPWATWNNRPFANTGELLHVPAFRSSQLLQAFSMRDLPTTPNEVYGDENENDPDGNNENDTNQLELSTTLTLETDGPYGHLLNFFRTEADNGADNTVNTADDRGIVGLHRLLDYVQVPSRFVGTETWLNPVAFGSSAVNDINDPRYLRQPPFNRVDEYRDPGRVNINTVVSPLVWDGGILHRELTNPTLPFSATNPYLDPEAMVTPPNPGHAGPNSQAITNSRRGYGDANDLGLQLDPQTPTFFSNPFRSADAGDLVPLSNMVRDGVEAAMLRSTSIDNTPIRSGMNADTPLFAANTVGNNNQFRDSDRNPYFRYQPITRLSSMTTTRSNVYAVWVTIGFFEVQEAPDRTTFATLNGFGGPTSTSNALYDRVYPEGFQLGQEAGSDTGDIRRVREFAIIDRTVPVAFEPGSNHNIDKAVRLRRRIE